MSTAERIFLIGPMGAGKSAVGRHLARILHYQFTDTDHEIEERTGVDVSFIFEKEGESGFRRREIDVFAGLRERSGIVIATGGGCVVSEENREVMSSAGFVIYLYASEAQLFERVRYGNTRPLLATPNPRRVLRDLMAVRGPLYEALADLTIDTGRRRVREVALYAARRLQQRGPRERHAHR